MKRKDYENVIEIEIKTAGSVSDFGRGLEVGAISILKHIISIDEDLDEWDRLYLMEMAEHAKMVIIDISKEKKFNSGR